jgi:hypothetical protein
VAVAHVVHELRAGTSVDEAAAELAVGDAPAPPLQYPAFGFFERSSSVKVT